MQSPAAESVSLRVQAEQIADAYLPTDGRPSLLNDSDKVHVLLASIRDGNYRETAIRQAGIAKQTFYNWLKQAEHGNDAAMRFVDALEKAEADAESETVRNVRNASKLPQFWAAGMTWLERKSPDKWGRRQDDASVPKVVVQIGVQASEVQVTFASPPASVSPDFHSLTRDHVSDNGDYGSQPQDAAPALSEPTSLVGRAIPEGAPARSGRPLSASGPESPGKARRRKVGIKVRRGAKRRLAVGKKKGVRDA